MEYKLRNQTETIAGIRLQLQCLESLDHTIDELFEALERTGNASLLEELCPYFGTVWPAARALAEEVATWGPRLQGKRVLELGCGLALPSLIAAKLGGDVTATDFHPEVPIFLRRNLALNQLDRVEYVRVDWAQKGGTFPELGSYDLVVGSDVLYERAHAETLPAVVQRYLAPGGTAIIADPARPYLQSFVDAMKARGFRNDTRVLTASDGEKKKEVFLVKLEAGK